MASVVVDPDQWLLDLPAAAPTRDNTLLATRPNAALPALGLYPNPCHHELNLVGLAAAPAAAQVRDATGRLVLRQSVSASQPQLDTRALRPGLYYLLLTSAQGQPAGRGQFVKE
ncbi:hypothetical protein BEN47_00055 [Hymenobacter lapidarius]|uniref:Secretion system C-terminal sorting domain-containing protein n=1 Tax=Hymenobacter lapidarius TaxID=1908237 RepID=A0A1G1T9Q7_9BACT|nr:T9SS type A sorting domain-containing protein [Hymenobacter lapidarius]OGX87608.1 hypothetical protein BEN47_00055 [Hymenobacter lapidarius]